MAKPFRGIRLSYLHLHSPLFLGGKNFGEKVTADKGITMTHVVDGVRDEIHVIYNGKCAYFPRVGNVALAVPVDHEEAGIEMAETKPQIPTNPVPKAPIKAQVSAPNGIKI